MVKLTRPPKKLAYGKGKLALPTKRALPFYQSTEWRALVQTITAARGKVCQHCGATGCRIYADHIVELRDGGAGLDPSNVQLLCAVCHCRKTEQRRRARAGLS